MLAGSNIINGRLNTIEGEAIAIKEARRELVEEASPM
jgi:hypothetical protein